MLKVQVRDFGPIREASVALRPLTILIGPNNAGKSYLASLVYSLQGKICDFLIFVGAPSLVVAVVEMKGKSVKASDVVNQLQAGANAGEKIANGQPVADFLALLLSQAIKHAADLKILRHKKVRFRGGHYRITRERCGAELGGVLRSAG